MALVKKNVVAEVNNYRIKPAEISSMRLSLMDVTKSNSFNAVRIFNNFPEPIVIINEYQETEVLMSSTKQSRCIEVYFNKPKIPVKNAEKYTCLNITLNYDNFENYGCVYIEELNIVIALAAKYDIYSIQHPFPIIGYQDIVPKLVQKLREDISDMGFVWYVNDPTNSGNEYYLNFGNEIVKLNTTNYMDDAPKLTIIAPAGNNVDGSVEYFSQFVNIKDLTTDEVRKVEYNYGKNNYVFYIGKTLNNVFGDMEKRKKIKKNFVSHTEHTNIVSNIESIHKEDIEKIKADHTNKLKKVVEDLEKIKMDSNDKLRKVMEDNENKINQLMKEKEITESILETSKRNNEILSQFHKTEADKTIADAKVNTVKNTVTKEKLSIFGDMLKYVVGGIITLVTVIIAQRTKTKKLSFGFV